MIRAASLTFFSLVFAVLTTTVSAVEVSGSITTQTWTKANSPYHLTGDVVVPTGETLTIEAGVDVVADSAVGITVYGTLIATGASDDSVRFIDNGLAPWNGITADSGARVDLAYTRISGAYRDHGGGLLVSNEGTLATLDHCLLTGNTAWYPGYIGSGGVGGGALVTAKARLEIRNSRIERNQAGQSGTAIAGTDASELVLYRAVIYDNHQKSGDFPWSGAGGGVFVGSRCVAEIVNCTIVDSYAGGMGNSYISISLADATVELRNSIVWKTGEQGAYAPIWTGTGFTVSYSLTWRPWQIMSAPEVGPGCLYEDPLFVDAAAGDFHLSPISPCINAGDPSSPLDPDGSRADMGAFPYDGTVGVTSPTPVPFTLAQNAPNPFNPVTSLRFSIPEACEVLLAIYDVNGRLVRTLVDGNREAGMHEVAWDARDDAGRAVASGVYVYRLTAGADVAVRRMVLVR